VWREYWPDGTPRAESTWRAGVLDGRSRTWRADGTLEADVEFAGGHRDDTAAAP
jgi:antitoxin component YwqK of YwqJK toxin-antitoxin module